MPELRLRPFERRHLPLVEPWFRDADTQRWLGGPGWPSLVLDLTDRPFGEYRGAMETGRYRWLAWDGDTAVGFIDCDTYDRCPTCEGGPAGGGVAGAVDIPSGSISYVVDPALRRRGYATAMIAAVLALPELAHIGVFTAGVEPANAASVGALLKAGFHQLTPAPDREGIIYYARSRPHP